MASTNPNQDQILTDLPRGVEKRKRGESSLPRGYFELPQKLQQLGFKDNSGDMFLGVIGATTHTDKHGYPITTGGTAVGYSDNRHITTIAGSRSGKGRSAIIPNLLAYGGSALIIDPKGENASVTARYRAGKAAGDKEDGKVYVLDPFGVTGPACLPYLAKFNPLSILLPSPRPKTIIEDAAFIADALVVPSGSADTHWDESAKFIAESVILHVATYFEIREKDRNLGTVADLLLGTVPFKQLLEDMAQNSAIDGCVQAASRAISEIQEKERSSILSTLRKNLRFLQSRAMRASVSGHDFDLEELKKRKATIYLVLPAVRMGACSQWLRLFINLTLAMAERYRGNKNHPPVLMILDEFAVLGPMRELERAIGQIAGYRLRIWTILQDIGQLKALYKDRWETFCGNSGMIQCFGNVDYATSNWISQYLDKTAIIVTDSVASTVEQRLIQGASGESDKQQIVDLMTAAEVRRYFARDDYYARQLVLIPGKRPYILQRANYDQHEIFAGRFDAYQTY